MATNAQRYESYVRCRLHSHTIHVDWEYDLVTGCIQSKAVNTTSRSCMYVRMDCRNSSVTMSKCIEYTDVGSVFELSNFGHVTNGLIPGSFLLRESDSYCFPASIIYRCYVQIIHKFM